MKINKLNLLYHHLNKRKISISQYYNGLGVSLFVIHDSVIIHKINKYNNNYNIQIILKAVV